MRARTRADRAPRASNANGKFVVAELQFQACANAIDYVGRNTLSCEAAVYPALFSVTEED